MNCSCQFQSSCGIISVYSFCALPSGKSSRPFLSRRHARTSRRIYMHARGRGRAREGGEEGACLVGWRTASKASDVTCAITALGLAEVWLVPAESSLIKRCRDELPSFGSFLMENLRGSAEDGGLSEHLGLISGWSFGRKEKHEYILGNSIKSELKDLLVILCDRHLCLVSC